MNRLSFLQLFPNRRRQLVALLMCRRYQYRTIQESPLFRILHILPGGFLQVFLLALMNEMLLFEPLKRLFKLPHRTLENSTAILLVPLTVNLRQAELLNLRVILQQPEKVARLHCRMLTCITHEKDTVIVPPRQLHDLHALTQGIQPRFVNNHIRLRRRFLS